MNKSFLFSFILDGIHKLHLSNNNNEYNILTTSNVNYVIKTSLSFHFSGYYADPEMQCQGYHVCLSSQFMPGIADRKMSFLCPNGTIFSQALFTCDWWYV